MRNWLMAWLALCLALLFGGVTASADPGAPTYSSWQSLGRLATPITATSTTAATALPTGGLTAQVCNQGSVDAYVTLGTTSGVTTDATTGSWIKNGTCTPFNLRPLPNITYTYIAAITASSTTTLYVEVGLGNISRAGGTSGGGGAGITSLAPGSANIILSPNPITATGTIDFSTTPALGAVTATSINKVALTAPATGATLALVDGTTITGPSATTTLPGLSLPNVFSSAVQTVQGLTTTSSGWYAQITGDTFARVRIGLNGNDIASLAMGSGSGARDTFIERAAAANVRFGAPDAAAPVAQIESVQNVVAGTSNVAGADRTLTLSQGTGTGVGGKLLVQGAPAGTTGTAQNALATLALFNNVASAFLLTPAVNTNALAVTGYSLTGTDTHSLMDLAGTWNVGTTVETALKLNVTDTASGAASLLADLQVGGSSVAQITKTGALNIVGNSNGQTLLTTRFGKLYFGGGPSAGDTSQSAWFLDASATIFAGRSTATIGWTSSTTNAAGTLDLSIFRDAANTLAQRNGVNAQKFRVYGTFTDASNGDWLEFTKAAGGLASIATVANGTGTAGNLSLTAGTVTASAILTAVGAISSGGQITAVTNFQAGAAGQIYFLNRTTLSSPSDGVLLAFNFAGTDFNRLQFGGTTSSFPALKRNAANLEVRLADDSAPTSAIARSLISSGAVPTVVLAGGTCAGTVIAGGSTAGTVTLTGACVTTNTMTLSVMPTAPTGYSCDAVDRTLGVSDLGETSTSTTGAVFTFGSTTGATDVIQYKCIAY